MKRVAQFACLLMVWGIMSVVTHADSTTTTSTTPADPKIILNDPACPDGAFCVDLTFTGETSTAYTSSNPLEFLTPAPVPDGLNYTCASTTDPSIACATILTQPPPVTLLGAYFWNFELSPGQVVTIASQGGPLQLDLPADFSCSDGCSDGVISLTPEPGTIILYAIGFLFLLGFAGRRFGFGARA